MSDRSPREHSRCGGQGGVAALGAGPPPAPRAPCRCATHLGRAELWFPASGEQAATTNQLQRTSPQGRRIPPGHRPDKSSAFGCELRTHTHKGGHTRMCAHGVSRARRYQAPSRAGLGSTRTVRPQAIRWAQGGVERKRGLRFRRGRWEPWKTRLRDGSETTGGDNSGVFRQVAWWK